MSEDHPNVHRLHTYMYIEIFYVHVLCPRHGIF